MEADIPYLIATGVVIRARWWPVPVLRATGPTADRSSTALVARRSLHRPSRTQPAMADLFIHTNRRRLKYDL
jgi:hypothetical protein